MLSLLRIAPFLCLLFVVWMTPAMASSGYVAIVLGIGGKIHGTGTGVTRDAAINEAYADCQTAANAGCGYHYWTRSSSHMVMMYCSLEVDGQQITGGLGNHQARSLRRAKDIALRQLQCDLLRDTCDHLKKDDCRVVASYPDGEFRGN